MATDSPEQNRVSSRMRRVLRWTDEIILRVSKHWLGIAIVGLFLFQTLPWLAPVLMRAGYVDQAAWIYAIYAPTCHQLAYRSYFLFGEQTAYSVAELQQHLESDHAANDLFFWRDLRGNAALGFKVAYCERDAAIYGTMWLCLIAYALIRKKRPIKPLRVRWFLFIFLPPIALDGLTQLFGLRESDPLLRTLTGAWFALGAMWLVLPVVDEGMRDLTAQTAHQLEQIQARDANVTARG